MSEIAKQKANQWILKHKDGDVLYVQDAYIAAYDQAMKDFLEKACDWLNENQDSYFGTRCVYRKEFFEDFKNYMQNEM